MNSVYSIMTPTKIALGKITRSINKSFIDDVKKYPIQNEYVVNNKVRSCVEPEFFSKMDLHQIIEIQDKYIKPYLSNVLLDLFVDCTHYCTSLRDAIVRYPKSMDMMDMWMTEFTEQTHFELHTHRSAPGYYSFVWYLKCDDIRKILFVAENKEHEITVQEGDIILFPGWLPHRSFGRDSVICSGNIKVDVQIP